MPVRRLTYEIEAMLVDAWERLTPEAEDITWEFWPQQHPEQGTVICVSAMAKGVMPDTAISPMIAIPHPQILDQASVDNSVVRVLLEMINQGRSQQLAQVQHMAGYPTGDGSPNGLVLPGG